MVNGQNMMAASNQWRDRPDDERFWDLQEMAEVAKRQRDSAATSLVAADAIHMIVDSDSGALIANGRSGQRAELTHYSFDQLSGLAGAPSAYLRKLPAQMTADCLNHGLQHRAEKSDVRLLLHRNGHLTLRAATSNEYTRIWDAEVIDGLMRLEDSGWRNPPGRRVSDVRSRRATQADCLRIASYSPGLAVKEGDYISPSGLYRSDRDMFAFMVDDLHRIEVDGAQLVRGIILWNSEVGDKSLGLQTFLFDGVCGNHIIWGARDVGEIRIRHSGKANERWERQIIGEVRRYANASDADDRSRIATCQRMIIGEDKDAVVAALFGRKALCLSKRTITEAYDTAVQTPRYGNPRSAWGMAQGLTEISQREKQAEKRMEIDRAAGKVLEIAF